RNDPRATSARPTGDAPMSERSMTVEIEGEALDGKTIAKEVARSLQVVREPLTYERHAPHSYFRDLIFQDRDARAAERLERHGRDLAIEMERRDKAARTQLPDELDLRTNPNVTDGQGGYFSPPLWLIDSSPPRRAPRVCSRI